MTQRHHPRERFQPIVRFWWSDASLSALLLFLFLVVFVIYPLHALGVFGGVLLDVFFSLIVVSGVVSVSTHRVTAVLAAILALVTLTLHWGHWAIEATFPMQVLDALASLTMLGMLATVVLIQAFREGPITLHRVQGAVSAYILIGVMFGIAYRLVTLFVPDAFSIPPHPLGYQNIMAGELSYFSFVTLTTVGYGDITALHPAARALATLEALIGQLFPAILIARLVSLEIHYRQLRRTSHEEHESKDTTP